MKRSLFFSVIFVFCAAFLHGATYRVPVMVLPFENRTEAVQLDRFTAWIKAELKNYGNIRLIEYYKSTNLNGTLLLFMKPSKSNPFGKKNTVNVSSGTPDTYYIVTGTITYSDFRYTIHADVINSATEWVIAKDDVYISGAENVRTLLAKELAKRLSMKMNFRKVETFDEKKVLNQAAATNQFGQQTNTNVSQQTVTPTAPTPAEQQNLYNEKKQVMIVFNTNEKKVLEDLQKKKQDTNANAAPKQQDKVTVTANDKKAQVSLEHNEPKTKPYNSPYENEIAVQMLISGDFRENSNAIFTSYELSYKYQILESFYIGLNLGAGLFDVKGKTELEVDYKYNIFQFRIAPNVLYRWYFIKPFYLDIQAGGGGFFGSANYNLTGSALPLEDGVNGFLVQGKAGIGLEVKRMTFTFYFAFEWDRVNYSDRDWTFDVLMTTIGLSAGLQF